MCIRVFELLPNKDVARLHQWLKEGMVGFSGKTDYSSDLLRPGGIYVTCITRAAPIKSSPHLQWYKVTKERFLHTNSIGREISNYLILFSG